MKQDIPVWLWMAFPRARLNKKLTPEEEELCKNIIKSIKDVARDYYWEDKILEKVLHVNKFDDSNMYGATPKK